MSSSFFKCTTFNVVLVGDSRVGKSTFIDQLQSTVLVDDNNPYRGTVLPEVKTLYMFDDQKILNNEHIVISLLDTPGLDEKPIDGVERPNEQLKDLISGHIKENFSTIDLILITIQRKGITDALMKSVYDMKEYFGNKYLRNMCLLITHCDNFKKEDEEKYLKELLKNEEMEDFCEAIQNRIIFTGKSTKDIKMIHELDFEVEQKRRNNKFLDYLAKSTKINLKKTANLHDLRPIDVLESAASTNKTILDLPIENSSDLTKIKNILFDLKNLKFDSEELSEMRDDLINNIGSFLNDFKQTTVSEEEITDARRYNEIEIPLKEKAEELRFDSYQLKTQLNSLKTSYNRLKLNETILLTPKKEEKTIISIGLKKKRKTENNTNK